MGKGKRKDFDFWLFGVTMVYISGQITGVKDYKQKFDEAEKILKSKGYEVFNPASNFHEDWTYANYMKFDIKHLLNCTHIYLLPGWEKSEGAKLEKLIADKCGIEVINDL